MAYPNPPAHFRLSFSGTFGSVVGGEIWTFGLSAAGGTIPTEGQPNAVDFCEILATQLAVDADILLAPLSSSTRLTRVRCALVGDDGLVRRTGEGAYFQGDALVNKPGLSTSIHHPPQIAIAVSLRSAVPGITGRGRFFCPGPALTVDQTDMRVGESNRDNFAASVRTFLQAVNSSLGTADPGLRLVIASGGSLLKGLPPATHTVIESGVGRVLDTMRSRRNALAEETEYVSLS